MKQLKQQQIESIQKADNDHDVITGLVKDMQNKSDRQIELIAMINDLQKEVYQLKESKAVL